MKYYKIVLILAIFTVSSALGLAQSTTQISLNSGWNIVSAPYYDFNINYTGCNIKAVYHYNPYRGVYQKSDTLGKLYPGIGYWVYSGNNCTLFFSGELNTTISEIG